MKQYFRGNDVRLICPNCATQYEVADADVPVTGRVVQCGVCDNEWTATRPVSTQDSAAPDSPDDTPEMITPDFAAPEEIASAISDALGERPDSTPEAVPDTAEEYAVDDRLSMDLDEEEEQPDMAGASDFDVEALRSLLSRQVSSRQDPAEAPTDQATNAVEPERTDSAPTIDATPVPMQHEYADEPHPPAAQPEEPDTSADFSIPPVPQSDTIRAGADAAFEAMRARRAERRAARQSDATPPTSQTLIEEPASEIDEADSVLNDLRRILDEPSQPAATLTHELTHEAEPDGDADALAPPPAARIEPETSDVMPFPPSRARPQRPGRPGAHPVSDHPVAPAAPRTARPARPGRPGATPPPATTLPAAANDNVPQENVPEDERELQEQTSPTTGGRGGLGFVMALMLALIAAAVYFLAADLAAALPPIAPALEAYVSTINSLRASIAALVNG
ncbi:hypothetical protein G8E03_06195 [Pontibrevibacter nitratireducens]|uniref:Zinc finger/thioredoxin putative domain-containing protein n=1 Tax=Pontivivens nitratireducens TaxID=2758038 RepID=A0A6G7VK68_9RHOB|nr:hypothetical protein G8E03_06195 [Pontibrevibacter nitratireducens]